MTKGIDWTSEMIHELKRLMALEANLSFGVIALRMSAKFGVTFTRNSAVGKAHRLRMPPRPLREMPTSRISRCRADANPARKAYTLPSDREPPSRRRKYDSNVQLIDLHYGACKWPEGNAVPYTFCGKPAAGDGLPYCTSHADMAYAKPKKSWV